MTEETDALAVVVSEETREISIAARGDLEVNVNIERLQELLTRHKPARPPSLDRPSEPEWKRAQL